MLQDIVGEQPEKVLELFLEYPYITKTIISSHLQLQKTPTEYFVTSNTGSTLQLNTGHTFYLHSRFINRFRNIVGCKIRFSESTLVGRMYMPTEKLVVSLKEPPNLPVNQDGNLVNFQGQVSGIESLVEGDSYCEATGPTSVRIRLSDGECERDWLLTPNQFWILEFVKLHDRIYLQDASSKNTCLYYGPHTIIYQLEVSQKTVVTESVNFWATVIGHIPHDEMSPVFKIGLSVNTEQATRTIYFEGVEAYKAANASLGHFVFVKENPIPRLYNISRIPSIPSSSLCPLSKLVDKQAFKYVDAVLVSIAPKGNISLHTCGTVTDSVDEFEYCSVCSEFCDPVNEPMYRIILNDGSCKLECDLYESVLIPHTTGSIYRFGITTWASKSRIDIMCDVPPVY